MNLLRRAFREEEVASSMETGSGFLPADVQAPIPPQAARKPSDVGLPSVQPAAGSFPMDDPLAVVNALHQIILGAGLHTDLALPMIAVVGSQSVGKTSVLESLVGRDFLPRGSGIVTRRPLILQLRATRSGSADEEPMEWAEFEHKPGEKFLRFELVRSEIELETQRLCGDNRGVSDEPILLRIFSPTVMDLTLVDLPGLTKVPTGEQPKDISQTIRQLVLRYVRERNCIILAVSAANSDLATSDALALAREVDPQGERTVGVLTKLDLAEEAGAALEALRGGVYPLRLGYIGVVCRSESASKAGLSFEEALKAEQDFLSRSTALSAVAAKCGIANLARRLQTLLLQHLRETLPELRARMQTLADGCRQELASYGDQELEKRMGQGPFLLHLISGYVRNFADMLEGRLVFRQQELPPAKLLGGARLHFIFHKVFGQAILDFDAFSGLSDLDIRVAMRNAAGPKPQLFVPEIAFETLVKKQIQKLEDPALQCVCLVFEELKQLASQSEGAEMQRFPGLREKTLEVAQRVIQRCLQPTSQMVSNLIRIEREYINVDHPDFIGGLRAMSSVQEAQPELSAPVAETAQTAPAEVLPAQSSWGGSLSSRSGTRLPSDDALRLPAVPLVVTPAREPSEKERMDTELLKSLVLSYFTIVKRKVMDSVPKTIMHFMVNAVRDALHAECIAELYKADLLENLLQEADDLRQRRQRSEAKLAELRKAQDLLSQICDAASQV